MDAHTDDDGFTRINEPGRLCTVGDAAVPCDLIFTGGMPQSRQDAPIRARRSRSVVIMSDPPLDLRAAWLSAPARNSPLPDHCCLVVARLTVVRWARHHLPGDGLIALLARTWPLPASDAAILDWAVHNGLATDDLPTPLLPGAEALYVGLVVERRTADGGTVTLQALVKSTNGQDGEWVPEPLLPPGARSTPEGSALYRFHREVLVGRSVMGPGSGAKFYTEPEFRRRYLAAYRAVAGSKEDHRRPAQWEVANELAMDRSTLLAYLRDTGMRWPPTGM